MAKQEREVERWITVNGARVPIFKGESKAEVKERIYRKNAGKHETKIRNMDDNWSRKLSRGEKEAMRMEVEKERREAGNPVKSSYGKTHSKLDQHSEIQKMADEHVRKIWTKEGGVANKELYDEADKFAEKNNLDKKKVRDAAFKAMNEKYADSLKLKKEGKDPLQNIKKESKQSKQINDDFDTKEKQIKQNEAERDKLNGSEKYAKSQNKSTLELGNELVNLKDKNVNAKINEMIKNGATYDNAVAIAHKQFIGDKKEAASEEKKNNYYSVSQTSKLGDKSFNTRLEKIEASNETEAIAKYKEKYPKAAEDRIKIRQSTKEGGRYQKEDGTWDDGHMFKENKEVASKKGSIPEFKSAEEAEKYYQEKFAGVSSTYANKMAAKLGIEGKGKEKREALAKAYTEKWKQSQSINKDLDLKEKQIAQNKSIKDKISAAEDRELERELKRTHPAAFGNSSQKESLNKPNWEVEKGRYGEATTTVGDTTYRIFYNKQWGQFTLKERRKDGAGWITTGGDFRHPITLGYSKQEALMNAMEYLENQKKRGRNNAKHL